MLRCHQMADPSAPSVNLTTVPADPVQICTFFSFPQTRIPFAVPASSLIVLGGSAGAMPALLNLVDQLPPELPAAVLVVLHFAAEMDGRLPVQRLRRNTALPCQLAVEGMIPENGQLYLAPPDRHLLVSGPKILVRAGPRENRFRPAVDALFRSAAVSFGQKTTGVILSGMLHDGSAGIEFIKRCGGFAVVQDPDDSQYPSMPATAISAVPVDYIVPVSGMGALLVQLTDKMKEQPFNSQDLPEDLKAEAAIAERVVGNVKAVDGIGTLAALSCPDCGGSLWELKHGTVQRFRCHTGHAFTAGELLLDNRKDLEETLWVALRMMEEQKLLLSRMGRRGGAFVNDGQGERINELKKHLDRLRRLLLTRPEELLAAGSSAGADEENHHPPSTGPAVA